MSFNLLNMSNHAYVPGTVLGQVVSFSGDKTIDKVSLYLNVTSRDIASFVTGSEGILSWPAAVFQESRSNWVFHPILHWLPSNDWETSGITIANTYQTESYDESYDALNNAPYLKYSLYFPEGGVYDMWGYGYTEESGFFWQIDADITHIRLARLGSDDSGLSGVPRWTKFGSLFFEEGGLHDFTVYLGSLGQVVLDQWVFTTNTDWESELISEGAASFLEPKSLSKIPFMTTCRLRSLSISGNVESLSQPSSGSISVSSWLPSTKMSASGKFNYEIRDNNIDTGVIFTNGLSLEYFQIGGSSDHFASWNYKDVESSVGQQFISTDYGQTIQ